MPKSIKKRKSKTRTAKFSSRTAKSTTVVTNKSKQDALLTLLRSPDGASIVNMMKATGWQPHSVRGFLSAVVRKRLKLDLDSTEVDGVRTYRIKKGTGVQAA